MARYILKPVLNLNRNQNSQRFPSLLRNFTHTHHTTLSLSSVCMRVRGCTEARGVVEIGAETAAQAAWSAQGAAVRLQEGVHAEGTPRTSH